MSKSKALLGRIKDCSGHSVLQNFILFTSTKFSPLLLNSYDRLPPAQTTSLTLCQSTIFALAYFFLHIFSISFFSALFPCMRNPTYLTYLFGLKSCFNALYNSVYSTLWSPTPSFSIARLVSATVGLILIKFFSCFSRFWMGFTNPSRAVRQHLPLLNFLSHLTLFGTLLSSINSFPLIFLFASLDRLHRIFQTDLLA